MILDRIFATIRLLMVVAFMGVVTIFVMEPDLWIVTIVVLSVAITFIWRDIKGSGSHLENDPEAGDTAIGGDTAPRP